MRKARARRPAGRPTCLACEGRGTITAAELGVVGMVADDGDPVPVPCLLCEGAGVIASPPDLAPEAASR